MNFSVLVPVCNVKDTLDRCLASVINQTYPCYEVILVDDGSTDGSSIICDKYCTRYPFVKVIHKKNDGLYMARVDAIKASKGDFLLFVDSDDYIETNSLELLKNTITSSPDIDMVIFREFITNLNAHEEIKTPILFNNGLVSVEEVVRRLVDTYDLNNLVMKCVRRPEDLNFQTHHHMNMAEDLALTCQFVLRSKKISYLDKPLYHYIMNQGSITHKATSANIVNATISRDEQLKMLVKMSLVEPNKKNLINEYIKNVAYFVSEISDTELKSKKFYGEMDTVKSSNIWKYLSQNRSLCNHSNKVFLQLMEKDHYLTVKYTALFGRKLKSIKK